MTIDKFYLEIFPFLKDEWKEIGASAYGKVHFHKKFVLDGCRARIGLIQYVNSAKLFIEIRPEDLVFAKDLDIDPYAINSNKLLETATLVAQKLLEQNQEYILAAQAEDALIAARQQERLIATRQQEN